LPLITNIKKIIKTSSKHRRKQLPVMRGVTSDSLSLMSPSHLAY